MPIFAYSPSESGSNKRKPNERRPATTVGCICWQVWEFSLRSENWSPAKQAGQMKAEADRASDNWRPKRAWLFLLTIVVVNLVLSTVLLGLRGGVRQAEFLTPNELGLIGIFGNSINLVI